MTRRRHLAFLAVLVFAVSLPTRSVHAQDWARTSLEKSPRHREYVAVQAGSRMVNTFVVYPEVAKKAPVVVLIHEIFGLSDWAKLMADELAAKGYIVLTPDLLSGTGPGAGSSPPGKAGTSPMAGGDLHADHAHAEAGASAAGNMPNQLGRPGSGTNAYSSMDDITRAVTSLPAAQVLSDLDAVASYGLKLPSANGKLAVAGFCWAGGKTFAFATYRKDIAGAFVFYGPPPPAAEMARITAPVYGFYAANDARIGATIPQATADMKAAGKRFEPVTYEGAGHGFMRAGQAPDASPENKKAWAEGFDRLTGQLASLQ